MSPSFTSGRNRIPAGHLRLAVIKAHDEAKSNTGLDLAIYLQEMDNATAALARMNTILHNCETADIWRDNTLSCLPGRARRALQEGRPPGYSQLKVPAGELKKTIFDHAEFGAFTSGVNSFFAKWKRAATHTLKGVAIGAKPKALIEALAEEMLETFGGAKATDTSGVRATGRSLLLDRSTAPRRCRTTFSCSCTTAGRRCSTGNRMSVCCRRR